MNIYISAANNIKALSLDIKKHIFKIILKKSKILLDFEKKKRLVMQHLLGSPLFKHLTNMLLFFFSFYYK